MKRFIIPLLFAFPACFAAAYAQENRMNRYATIEGKTDGVPIYSFNSLMYVYGEGPELYSGAVLQKNNDRPKTKLKLKKSSEIRHNFAGSEHEMTPRTPRNDAQAMLPIHLIDGDPDTVWTSWGDYVPDARPEWIRIDFPAVANVTSISLVCHPKYMGKDWNYGKALPKEVEILVSRDAYKWESVYKNNNVAEDATGIEVKLDKPVQAKQIWIKANHFPKTVRALQHVFSINGVEVLNDKGENIALASRGAGVTVSSVSFGYHNDRISQDVLWTGLQYDLGNKWVRFGAVSGSLLWYFTELEKGKFEIDQRMDEVVTELAENGIDTILTLDYNLGNRLYTNPPRDEKWEDARYKEIHDYYNNPTGTIIVSEEMRQGYLRYVEFMVRHFKDRVTCFEIANEWNLDKTMTTDMFMNLIFEPTYDIIRKIAPDAKIMFGSPAGFPFPESVIMPCLGPGVSVQDGKLTAAGRALWVTDKVSENDVTVSVKVKSEAISGLVLRFDDSQIPVDDLRTFIVAVYDRLNDRIYFQDVMTHWKGMGGILEYPQRQSLKVIEPLGPEVRMTATVNKDDIVFEVTDGVKTFSITGQSSTRRGRGLAGIVHCPWRGQSLLTEGTFSDLQVRDASGKVVYTGFTGMKPGDGMLLWNYWGDKSKPIPAKRVQYLGWHPVLLPDKAFFDDTKAFQRECRAAGFNGKFVATEIYAGSIYPPGPDPTKHQHMTSEFGMAKYLTQSLVGHSALNIGAGPCHPHFTSFPHPQSLSRVTWPVQTVIPCQPTPTYYAWRNIATAMDNYYQADFPVRYEGEEDIVHFTLKNGDDDTKLMLAAWIMGTLSEQIAEKKTDITLPGMTVKQAWVIDVFNGTEQELMLTPAGNGTVLKDMMIKDYPVLIRLEK